MLFNPPLYRASHSQRRFRWWCRRRKPADCIFHRHIRHNLPLEQIKCCSLFYVPMRWRRESEWHMQPVPDNENTFPELRCAIGSCIQNLVTNVIAVIFPIVQNRLSCFLDNCIKRTAILPIRQPSHILHDKSDRERFTHNPYEFKHKFSARVIKPHSAARKAETLTWGTADYKRRLKRFQMRSR